MKSRSLSALVLALLATGLLHCSSDSGETPSSVAGAGAVAGVPAGSAGAVASAGGGSVAGGAGAASTPGGSGGVVNANGGGGLGGSGGAPSAGNAGNAGSAGSAGSAAVYNPCPPVGSKCVIMPLGDSITEGYGSSTGGGYRLRLLHDIWGANHDATFVGNNSGGPNTLDNKPFPKNNEGHSGYTIDDAPALKRTGISPLVAASLQKHLPHIVTLMIGTNDIGTNNDVANAPKRLAALIDLITTTSPNALLVVAQITPLGDNSGNGRAQQYNAAIPELVKARVATGKHIIVVDMYTPFIAHPEYMNGLHPKDIGYDFMGDAWYTALASHL